MSKEADTIRVRYTLGDQKVSAAQKYRAMAIGDVLRYFIPGTTISAGPVANKNIQPRSLAYRNPADVFFRSR